jgi:hypothetical protein
VVDPTRVSAGGDTVSAGVGTVVGTGTVVTEGSGKVIEPVGVRIDCGSATGSTTFDPAACGSGISGESIRGPPRRLLTISTRYVAAGTATQKKATRRPRRRLPSPSTRPPNEICLTRDAA